MTDVILSRGNIGRSRPADGATPVELIFCNPDLLWRSEFPRPRLGQGAFREAFQAVFKVCHLLFFLIEIREVDLFLSRLSRVHRTLMYSTASQQKRRMTLRKRCCAHA